MEQDAQRPQKHIWPWIVLAVLIVGVALAIIWMTAEVRRTNERKKYVIPTGTNETTTAPR